MKSLTVAAILWLASSTFGAPAPQGLDFFGFKNFMTNPFSAFRNCTDESNNIWERFGLPATGDLIRDVPNQGPSFDTEFGAFPLKTEHFMTLEERNQYIPVLMALERVMRTSNPSPNDINTLLVLTRDLSAQIPDGEDSLFGAVGSGGFFGGFGLDGIKNMGLIETGDPIVISDNVPYIVTQFGAFPLPESSRMTDEERAKFLPSVRTFIGVLEKDTLDPEEINELLVQARDITPTEGLSDGFFGGIATQLEGGLIAGLLGGALGSLDDGLGRLIGGCGGDSLSLSNFGIPATGPLIKNIPNQGPSWNLEFAKIPLDRKNLMTPEERNRFLPVMRALLKVMETSTPAPEDVNTLLVLSRDLSKYIPEASSQFTSFVNVNGIENMGLLETGDVIIDVDGEPHIQTQFGTLPLSEVSLMTDEERQQFLPVARTFISVMEKDDIDPSELNTLLEQSRELTNLIPNNLFQQINEGVEDLGGIFDVV